MRPLGTTGIAVSPLGLGTVKLGRVEGVKYPEGYDLPSDDAARGLLSLARDLGISLIDTAPAYGTSEERLGRLLRGQRDAWTIVTKAGEEFAHGTSRFDFSRGAVRASVERSLRRLRTDRVECVLLHSDGRDAWILRESGAMDELESMRREGKVRSIGISAKSREGVLDAIGRCDVVMATLHPAYLDEMEAIRAAGKAGVGVLIKKALASGHVRSVEDSLRLALAESAVSSVVVGTISREHLRENARIAGEVVGA